MIWSNNDLKRALSLEIGSDLCGNAVCYNSKNIQPGDIFIAFKENAFPTIKGTNDSHGYIKDAFDKGASFAIVEHLVDDVDQSKLIIVADSFIALLKLAHYKRSRANAKFIAITGSAGKTSTKEICNKVLSSFGNSYSNFGSFNNEVGLQLTLASMPDDVDYVVLEVGMNHKGELNNLVRYIKPDVAVINNILPTHIGNFNSLDDIADAKLEVINNMNQNGIVIFNAESPYYERCVKKAESLDIKHIYGFGIKNGDAKLESYKYNGQMSSIKVDIMGHKLSFLSNVIGDYRAQNLVVALMIANILGLDPAIAAQSLADITPIKGRGEIYDVKYGSYQCKVINDSYNASPISMKYAIENLMLFGDCNKIIIIANMMELGERAIEYHKNLLEPIINSGVNEVYTVGNLMYELHKILPYNIKTKHFEDYSHLMKHLDEIITSDMLILFKGSNSQNLQKVVTHLVKE